MEQVHLVSTITYYNPDTRPHNPHKYIAYLQIPPSFQASPLLYIRKNMVSGLRRQAVFTLTLSLAPVSAMKYVGLNRKSNIILKHI